LRRSRLTSCFRGSAIRPPWPGATTSRRPTSTERPPTRHTQEPSAAIRRRPAFTKPAKNAVSPGRDGDAQYPRQGFVDRDLAGKRRWFSEGTSLNPHMFQCRPSPLAAPRCKERPAWLARRSIHPRSRKLVALGRLSHRSWSRLSWNCGNPSGSMSVSAIREMSTRSLGAPGSAGRPPGIPKPTESHHHREGTARR